MEQIIENAKLRLVSSGGIRPMVKYSGWGKLDIDQKGFRFEERLKRKHTRNVRISKKPSAGNDSIFFLPDEGRFRMTLFLDTNECTLKAIQEKVKPLLAEAKEGDYL